MRLPFFDFGTCERVFYPSLLHLYFLLAWCLQGWFPRPLNKRFLTTVASPAPGCSRALPLAPEGGKPCLVGSLKRSRTCLSMHGVNDPPLFIKDIKAGLKNLNVVFIVLEIGK